MAKRQAVQADQLDQVRIHGSIRAVRVTDHEVELRFTISGSVEVDGVEYIYDERVVVTAERSSIQENKP